MYIWYVYYIYYIVESWNDSNFLIKRSPICLYTTKRQGNKGNRLKLLKFKSLFKKKFSDYCSPNATIFIKRRISQSRRKLRFAFAPYTGERTAKDCYVSSRGPYVEKSVETMKTQSSTQKIMCRWKKALNSSFDQGVVWSVSESLWKSSYTQKKNQIMECFSILLIKV